MTLLYTDKEMNKIRITQKFIDKKINIIDACTALKCSERTIYRYQDLLITEGPPGFVHGLKGRPPNHNINSSKFADIDKIITLPKFSGFGPTFLAEKLWEIYGITINHESLRQRMIKLKLRIPHKRKAIISRQKRQRKPSFGMLIQFDGSYHDRLENGEQKCLLCAVDDATSKITFAQFTNGESLNDIFEFWKQYFHILGKPQIIYIDRHSTYKVNHPRDQFDKEMCTRFQRAMESMGIIVIYAKCPEGKGRVERSFGTHQDRLVKEMRLQGIYNYNNANSFLQSYYIKKHNSKFSVPAKEKGNYHTESSSYELSNLEWIFAKIDKRSVKRDGTIQYQNNKYQLNRNQYLPGGGRVTVKKSIYNKIKIFSSQYELPFTVIKGA